MALRVKSRVRGTNIYEDDYYSIEQENPVDKHTDRAINVQLTRMSGVNNVSPSEENANGALVPTTVEGTETDPSKTIPETTLVNAITVKNRRQRYLDLHPEYFDQSHLELADPLLYDRMVRRFQSATEREQQGKQRGYSGVLEADLFRSEAKLHALQHPDPNTAMLYTRAPDGSILAVEQSEQERAVDRADGWGEWREVMGLRFVQGRDAEFDYAEVDQSEEFDDRGEMERVELERYLDAEEEDFVGEGCPIGETGVQDF